MPLLHMQPCPLEDSGATPALKMPSPRQAAGLTLLQHFIAC